VDSLVARWQKSYAASSANVLRRDLAGSGCGREAESHGAHLS